MASGTELFNAWKEALANKDSSRLSEFFTEDFKFVGTVSQRNDTKQETLNRVAAGDNSIAIDNLSPRIKDTKYTPISIRQDKPYAILWCIKKYPNELTDSQIAKLTSSTKNTVNAIRNGTYREAIFETKNPMDIGLCTYEDLEKALNKTRKKNLNNKVEK